MRIYADNVEVSWQNTDDGVLVRAEGGIAANETITWRIRPALSPSSFASQAWVTDTGTYYEIDNGLVACRIPKVIPCEAPATWDLGTYIGTLPNGDWSYATLTPSQILAPIQEFRHRDGTWTGTGPNYLMEWNAWRSGAYGTANWPATAPATVEIIENGPLRAKVRVSYVGLRQGYYFDTTEAGVPKFYWVDNYDNGYLICTITVEAGQNTIQVETRTDTRASWNLDMNTGVSADLARFKCHDTTTAADGHNFEGADMAPDSGYLEAECSLSAAGIRSGNDWTGKPWGGSGGVYFLDMARWTDWPIDTGVYWYAYSSAGGSSSNMWAIIQGRASQFTKESYTGVYGKPDTGTPTEFGFYTKGGVQLTLDGVGHESKYIFNIFLGTKGVDVPVNVSAYTLWETIYPSVGPNAGAFPTSVSGVSRAHSLLAGTGQAWKLMYQSLEFPDPVGGYEGMHLTRTDTEELIANLEADQGPGSYYQELYNSDTTSQDLWQALANVGGGNTKATEMVQYCLDYIHIAMDVYVNKGSHFSPWWVYWQGGIRFQIIVVRAMALISLDQVRPFLTVLQKKQLKAVLAAVGHITWDEDFVPTDDIHGQWSYGNINMPVQFGQQRSQFGVTLKTHPQFAERFDGAYAFALNAVAISFVASGAAKDSPHYAETLIVPTFDVFRQLQVSGYADVFAPDSEIYDKIVLICEWLIQLTTPPQARFKKTSSSSALRKMVCYGNGSSEANRHVVAFISGLKDHNPTLSKRLAWIWIETGKSLFSFYSCTGLKIATTVLSQDPMLGDADFADSFTVFPAGGGRRTKARCFYCMARLTWITPRINAVLLQCICLALRFVFRLGRCRSDYIQPVDAASTYIPESEMDSDNVYPSDVELVSSARHGVRLSFPIFHDTYTYSFAADRGDLTCSFIVTWKWVRKVTYYRDDLACR